MQYLRIEQLHGSTSWHCGSQHSDGLPTQLAMYQTPKKIKAHCLPLQSSGANGKAKMHELYTLWLSCKGIWAECSLVIKATKSKSQDAVETYDFLVKKDLIKELGDETLAKDLMDRHVQAEAKLNPKQKGQFIKVYFDQISYF